MTNFGCSVCLQTIATYTRNAAGVLVVSPLPGHTFTDKGIVCGVCGSLDPLDSPAICECTVTPVTKTSSKKSNVESE